MCKPHFQTLCKSTKYLCKPDLMFVFNHEVGSGFLNQIINSIPGVRRKKELNLQILRWYQTSKVRHLFKSATPNSD